MQYKGGKHIHFSAILTKCTHSAIELIILRRLSRLEFNIFGEPFLLNVFNSIVLLVLIPIAYNKKAFLIKIFLYHNMVYEFFYILIITII